MLLSISLSLGKHALMSLVQAQHTAPVRHLCGTTSLLLQNNVAWAATHFQIDNMHTSLVRFQHSSPKHDPKPCAGTFYKGHSLESPEQRKLHESDEYLKMQMERYLDLRAQEGDVLVLISGGAFMQLTLPMSISCYLTPNAIKPSCAVFKGLPKSTPKNIVGDKP